MNRLACVLLVPILLVSLSTHVQASGCSGCNTGCCDDCMPFTGLGAGPQPYWIDSFACLHPWPNDNCLMRLPQNWAWIFPSGGFTAYLGTPGSGVQANSDYSHIHWVVSPQQTAQNVQQKLDALGIPRVPQDTIFLGKNPGTVDKAKLPIPRKWVAPEENKEAEKEKGKDKGKDADTKDKAKDEG